MSILRATVPLWKRVTERAIQLALLACALLSIGTTIAIIWVLLAESIEFFKQVPFGAFIFGTRWAPNLEPRSYGVLPLVGGTALVAAGALLVAVPLGLCTSIYLSEYAPGWVRQVAKPLLEILAGIPTVVYGVFALRFITPHLLRPIDDDFGTFNVASAAIVVGIMIMPTICSLCDDAFRAVPRVLREGAYALSATKFEVSTRVVLPAALSGVVAAILLALARAVGETMAVTLAAGSTPNLTVDPRESVQTMTAFMAQVSMGDTPAGSLANYTVFAVGLALFAITLVINIIAQRVLRRFQERYE